MTDNNGSGETGNGETRDNGPGKTGNGGTRDNGPGVTGNGGTRDNGPGVAGNGGTRDKAPEMGRRYDDMIDLPRPVSRRHRTMAREKRAAQFAPFAALNGYDAAIREEERLTQQRRELNEDSLKLLDEKLHFLMAQDQPMVGLTWFVPDGRKAGGHYMDESGRVKKLDMAGRRLILDTGREIPLDEIVDIRIEGRDDSFFLHEK